MDDEELPAWRLPDPVVLPVRLDPSGRCGPTRSAARGGRWRRTSHGWYVPSWVDPTLPEQRVAEAVPQLALGGVVTGWGALRMWGANFLDGRAHDGAGLWPVMLAQGWHAAPRPPGAGTRQHQLRVGPCSTVGGVPVHAAVPALVDEMRLAPDLAHAVVCADAARAAQIVTCREMSHALAARAGWLGIAQARHAWGLSRDDVRSPPESRLRLVGHDLDLTDLLVNVPVFSLAGRCLGLPRPAGPRGGSGPGVRRRRTPVGGTPAQRQPPRGAAASPWDRGPPRHLPRPGPARGPRPADARRTSAVCLPGAPRPGMDAPSAAGVAPTAGPLSPDAWEKHPCRVARGAFPTHLPAPGGTPGRRLSRWRRGPGPGPRRRAPGRPPASRSWSPAGRRRSRT